MQERRVLIDVTFYTHSEFLVAVEKRNTNFPKTHYMFDIILVTLGKFNLDKHSTHNYKDTVKESCKDTLILVNSKLIFNICLCVFGM